MTLSPIFALLNKYGLNHGWSWPKFGYFWFNKSLILSKIGDNLIIYPSNIQYKSEIKNGIFIKISIIPTIIKRYPKSFS